jgi:DNA-binding CsgD family transcriptional regulator
MKTMQPLTDREKEILTMIGDGKERKEIAEQLFISIRTVDTHRTKIMKKLNINNTADLIKAAIRLKLTRL